MFAPAPPLADTPTRAIERGLSSDSTGDAGGDGRISLSGLAPAKAAAHNHKPLEYGFPLSRWGMHTSEEQTRVHVRVATGGATASPPPLAGEGQGGGIHAPISIACPLPTPPPQAGEGA